MILPVRVTYLLLYLNLCSAIFEPSCWFCVLLICYLYTLQDKFYAGLKAMFVHQGGKLTAVQQGYLLTFPVSFTSVPAVTGNDTNAAPSDEYTQVLSFGNASSNAVSVYSCRINKAASEVWCRWIAVGK